MDRSRRRSASARPGKRQAGQAPGRASVNRASVRPGQRAWRCPVVRLRADEPAACPQRRAAWAASRSPTPHRFGRGADNLPGSRVRPSPPTAGTHWPWRSAQISSLHRSAAWFGLFPSSLARGRRATIKHMLATDLCPMFSSQCRSWSYSLEGKQLSQCPVLNNTGTTGRGSVKSAWPEGLASPAAARARAPLRRRAFAPARSRGDRPAPARRCSLR
jgi:hypothetical protein